MTLKSSISHPLCFALASYGVSVSSLTLACAVWLSLFSIPPGTQIRPMGEALASLLIAFGGTAIAICLAAVCIAIGRKRVVAWVAGLICVGLALIPAPMSIRFADWVIQTQGLIPKP